MFVEDSPNERLFSRREQIVRSTWPALVGSISPARTFIKIACRIDPTLRMIELRRIKMRPPGVSNGRRESSASVLMVRDVGKPN